MKTSFVRGLSLFAAGALCGSIISIAGAPPNPAGGGSITLEDFEKHANLTLAEIGKLGGRVIKVDLKAGRVGVFLGDDGECVSPPNPTNYPPVIPPVALTNGGRMFEVLNAANTNGSKHVFYPVGRCRVEGLGTGREKKG